MKTITLFLTGIMISIQLFSSQNLMADNNLTEIQKTKYKLTRYLLPANQQHTSYIVIMEMKKVRLKS
jgi:hypothetical protein